MLNFASESTHRKGAYVAEVVAVAERATGRRFARRAPPRPAGDPAQLTAQPRLAWETLDYRAPTHQFSMASREVVVDNGTKVDLAERFATMAIDVTGSTGDEKVGYSFALGNATEDPSDRRHLIEQNRPTLTQRADCAKPSGSSVGRELQPRSRQRRRDEFRITSNLLAYPRFAAKHIFIAFYENVFRNGATISQKIARPLHHK